MLVQEYHDGILLFAISDKEVWGKAIRDTIGLENFYKKNKDKYQWKERIDATIYKCNNDSIAKLVKGWLSKGIELDSIIGMANKQSALNLHFERGKYEAGTNVVIDQIKKEKGISNIIKVEKTYVVVDIKEILPPQDKSLDDARGLITADYQNYLEQKWIERLKKKYVVVINRELLEQ
jgi:peptidyl-prolyl cis-trans isomerase SurA